MRNALVGAIVVAGGLSCNAQGGVNVFELNSSAHVQLATAPHSSGGTSVFVTQLPSAVGTGFVFIETTTNDPLGRIEIKNQSSSHPIEIFIRGANGNLGSRPASLVEIVGGDGLDNANEIVIRECQIIGPVDAITGVNLVDGLEMGGGRTFYMTLDHASYPDYEPPALLNSTIGGAVGAIFLSYYDSLIDGVTIERSLGDWGQTSVIRADHIGSLRIGGIADGWIQGGTSQYVTTVHQIIFDDTLDGDGVLAGQLWINKLESAGVGQGSLIFQQGIAPTGVVGVKQDLLLNDADIQLPVNGLGGRIVIGADGVAADWTAPIQVGSTSLLGSYTQLASEIGGGVVGVVPFKIHGTDSSPVFGSNVAFLPGAILPEYDIRHYGWVRFAPGSQDPTPIRIERRPQCLGAPWLDVTDEWQFEYSIPNDGQSSIVEMVATVAAPYRNGFEYRFVREDIGENGLYCYLESFDPLLVPVAEYPDGPWFSVGSQCPWDITGDDNTNIDDLNAMLSDWNTTGNNLAGDVNGTGACDIDDLNLILTHWNETACEGCAESSLPGGGNEENSMMSGFFFSGGAMFNDGDLLVSELGYATVEDFCADLATMNAEEQDVMLTALEVAAEN